MKCKKCNGTRMVGIGNGIRGIKKCDSCNGTGHVDEYKKAIIFDRWFFLQKNWMNFAKVLGMKTQTMQMILNLCSTSGLLSFVKVA